MTTPAPKKTANPLLNRAPATAAPIERKRPTAIPRDKAADGFLNIKLIDANGVHHTIKNVTISLHEGYGNKLHDALLAKAVQYETELAEHQANAAANPQDAGAAPVQPVFNIVGTVALNAESLDPVL